MLPQTTQTTTETLTVRLSSTERDELAGLAEQLAGTQPRLIDEPDWVASARVLSSRLPRALRDAIRAYRHDPGDDGTLILGNLPVDVDVLPPTPTVPDSVEEKATVPAAIAALISLNLGEIIAYRDEKSGALVQNVVPVPGREASQSNAGSRPLELHVENAFHPNRPDYVGLLCLRHDRGGSAGTLVSSIRQALRLLPADVQDVLSEKRFTTSPPPSFRGGDPVPLHAVLHGAAEDPDVRVDFHATRAADKEAAAAMSALRDAFLTVSRQLVLNSGEMAFVDNRVSIHGRTAFTPHYDGHDRWLHRTFVHLDNRRSRSRRTGNSPVLR